PSPGRARSRRRAVARALRLRLEGAVSPVARSGDGAGDARRDAPRRVLQERRVLLDVRPEVLQHAHQPCGAGVQQAGRRRQEDRQAHARPLHAVRALRFLFVATAVAMGGGGCGRGATTAAPVASSSATAATQAADAGAVALAEDDGGGPMDGREAEAWSRAQDGGDDDDLRLADLVGCSGLRERAATTALRPTALRAMAYS